MAIQTPNEFYVYAVVEDAGDGRPKPVDVELSRQDAREYIRSLDGVEGIGRYAIRRGRVKLFSKR